MTRLRGHGLSRRGAVHAIAPRVTCQMHEIMNAVDDASVRAASARFEVEIERLSADS